MTAVDAYAAYLRSMTGREPETCTGNGGTTLVMHYGPALLTITFRAMGSRCDFQPYRIHIARDGGSTFFAPGQLRVAVDALLRGGASGGGTSAQ